MQRHDVNEAGVELAVALLETLRQIEPATLDEVVADLTTRARMGFVMVSGEISTDAGPEWERLAASGRIVADGDAWRVNRHRPAATVPAVGWLF